MFQKKIVPLNFSRDSIGKPVLGVYRLAIVTNPAYLGMVSDFLLNPSRDSFIPLEGEGLVRLSTVQSVSPKLLINEFEDYEIKRYQYFLIAPEDINSIHTFQTCVLYSLGKLFRMGSDVSADAMIERVKVWQELDPDFRKYKRPVRLHNTRQIIEKDGLIYTSPLGQPVIPR